MFDQIYNCHKQEENKTLEKTHRQKVMEVEKLSQTIQELEEVVLASGATANAVRDYKRQISELQVGKSYSHPYHVCRYDDYLVDLSTCFKLQKLSGGEEDFGEGASEGKSFSQQDCKCRG